MRKNRKLQKWCRLVLLFSSFLLLGAKIGLASSCEQYGSVDSFLNSYPTVQSWYHFYVEKSHCNLVKERFFNVLARSEALSIQLAEAKTTFEQCYLPIVELAGEDFDPAEKKEAYEVAGNLISLEQCLKKAMQNMTAADQDYFRSMVLFQEETDFV